MVDPWSLSPLGITILIWRLNCLRASATCAGRLLQVWHFVRSLTLTKLKSSDVSQRREESREQGPAAALSVPIMAL